MSTKSSDGKNEGEREQLHATRRAGSKPKGKPERYARAVFIRCTWSIAGGVDRKEKRLTRRIQSILVESSFRNPRREPLQKRAPRGPRNPVPVGDVRFRAVAPPAPRRLKKDILQTQSPILHMRKIIVAALLLAGNAFLSQASAQSVIRISGAATYPSARSTRELRTFSTPVSRSPTLDRHGIGPRPRSTRGH